MRLGLGPALVALSVKRILLCPPGVTGHLAMMVGALNFTLRRADPNLSLGSC